jgi:type IV secretion system protein VirB1
VILALTAMLGLAQQCAPTVAPETLVALVRVESGFDPLAIGVNGVARAADHPAGLEAAIATARRLIAAGRNVDLGLGQINSRNLPALGLSVAEAFDPCRNLAASARVLAADFLRAAPGVSAQAGLRTALSLYNTGDARRGFRNGYVARVTAAAGAGAPSPAPVLPEPSWDVFARPAPAGLRLF